MGKDGQGDRLWSPRVGLPLGLALLLGITLLTGAETAAAQMVPTTIEELVAKAARQGTLRVIVEVKIDPPGPPSREAIAEAQDHVLQELAGTSHRVLRRFTTVPFMGMETSADALRRLGASAHVAGIRQDMVLKPSGGEATLAKVGSELRALYEAYRLAQEQGRPLVTPDPTIRVVEDRVIVDAVASGDVEALKARLVALGMQGAVTAGRIVSGQLPIAQIAAMAALPELRFARAAMPTTHGPKG